MPVYEITAPNGSTYQVEGDGTEEEALAHFQSTYEDAPVAQAPKQLGMVASAVKRITDEWNDYPGYVKSALRGGARGVAGLPNMLADTAVRGANTLGLSGVPEQDLPSNRFKRFLDQAGLPVQPGIANQLVEMTGETLGGMYGTPGIGTATQAMPGRYPPMRPNAQEYAQQVGLQAGYKLPPTSVKRTAFGNILESLASPAKLKEELTTDNQLVRNALMRREAGDFAAQQSGNVVLGMRPNEVLTGKGLTDNISAIWNEAYKPLINNPVRVPLNSTFYRNIRSIIKDTAGNPASPEFRTDIASRLNRLAQTYNSDDILQTIKALRSDADDIARSTAKKDTAMARALSEAAGALEDRLSTVLRQRGNPAAYNDFVAGREQMAKLATIRNATLDPTGNVDAASLANRIKKGLPTTGNAYTSGMFSANFPMVSGLSQNAETELFDRISPGLGVSWIGGLAQGLGSPARKYLRSKNYQTLLRRPGLLDTEKRMLLSAPGSINNNNLFGQPDDSDPYPEQPE